jgi:hypothetical protein
MVFMNQPQNIGSNVQSQLNSSAIQSTNKIMLTNEGQDMYLN